MQTVTSQAIRARFIATIVPSADDGGADPADRAGLAALAVGRRRGRRRPRRPRRSAGRRPRVGPRVAAADATLVVARSATRMVAVRPGPAAPMRLLEADVRGALEALEPR